MTEILSQRPIFEHIESYLRLNDLLSLVRVDRRMWKKYTLVWYRKVGRKMQTACELGRLDVLRYMEQKDELANKSNKWMMCYAAKNDKLDVMKWLHDRGYGCTYESIHYAAQNGHLESVKWLYDNKMCGFTECTIFAAIINGHLDVVKYLYQMQLFAGIEPTISIIDKAIQSARENKELELEVWLQKYRDGQPIYS